MAEGTHAASTTQRVGSRKKMAVIVAGTGLAVLGAGVLMQVLRAPSTKAQVETAENGKEKAGRASVGGPKQYLARVNGQLITRQEVANECLARHGQGVLENIINRKIIQQACAERGIEITTAEVNREVARIAGRFNLPVETWYQMLQTERDLTPMQYRRDVIWPMLALKKLAGDEVTMTEKDLKKAYERDFGPKVKAKMILMNNLRRAQEVWNKAVENPEEFGKLAREHSQEPNSASLDGSIPPIRRHSGNEKLEKAAFELEPGEVSGIVQVGPNRYVILKCEGRTEQVASFEEVKEELRDRIRREKKQKLVARVFEKLKSKAQVDNYLTNTSSGGDIQQTSGSQKKGGSYPRPATPKSQRRSLPSRGR